MSLDADTVRRVASLARIRMEPAELARMEAELNGILAHMEELSKVKTREAVPVAGVAAGGMPLRTDTGPPLPLARARDRFAPAVRDGFLLVPRLATHTAAGAVADAAGAAEELPE